VPFLSVFPQVFFRMIMKDQALPIRSVWPVCIGLIVLIGCAEVTPTETEPTPAQRALIGKTKQALLFCAGPPVIERTNGDQVLFVYYREASQLDESFAGSKGSFARMHRGCRATIMINEDRVREVRYEGEPNADRDHDYCEDIFERCISP
jgi:hypothetical protein